MTRSCLAQVPCPLNYINGTYYSDPTRSAPCASGEDCGGGQYDVVSGTIEATAAAISSCASSASDLWVDDVFTVSNLQTGLPITFRVRLEAAWYVNVVWPPSAIACTYVGTPQDGRWSCWNGISDPAEITITRLVGQPFGVLYRVTAGFTGFEYPFCDDFYQVATSQGRLAFLDLPPGAVVTSCQGFVQGAVTAVGSIEEQHTNLSIERLSPNPTSGPFMARVRLPRDYPALLEVFDVRGRLVARTEVSDARRGERTVSVPLRSPVSSGIYLVRLTQGPQSVCAKQAVVR